MSLQSVYFDLDGVVVDSFGIHQRAWSKAFSSVNVNLPIELTDDLRSVPAVTALQEICKRLRINLSDESLSEIGRLKDRIRDKEIKSLVYDDCFPWARKILNECKTKGIKIHCLATTRAAGDILERLRLLDSFDTVTCGNAIETPKRKSAKTLVRLLSKERVAFENSLYLDDSPEAIRHATNTGIPSYLVNLTTFSNLSSIESLQKAAIANLVKSAPTTRECVFGEKRKNHEKR
jgi:beta-phosphoglucomutase